MHDFALAASCPESTHNAGIQSCACLPLPLQAEVFEEIATMDYPFEVTERDDKLEPPQPPPPPH
jgi:hypothetical protein